MWCGLLFISIMWLLLAVVTLEMSRSRSVCPYKCVLTRIVGSLKALNRDEGTDEGCLSRYTCAFRDLV